MHKNGFLTGNYSFVFVCVCRWTAAVTKGDHLAQSLHASLPQTTHTEGTVREMDYLHHIVQDARILFSPPSVVFLPPGDH